MKFDLFLSLFNKPMLKFILHNKSFRNQAIIIVSILIISIFNISTFELWHVHKNECLSCCIANEFENQISFTNQKSENKNKECPICHFFINIFKDYYIQLKTTINFASDFIQFPFYLSSYSYLSVQVFLNRSPPITDINN